LSPKPHPHRSGAFLLPESITQASPKGEQSV
jgi:hypothetical protein